MQLFSEITDSSPEQADMEDRIAGLCPRLSNKCLIYDHVERGSGFVDHLLLTETVLQG